jgi:hypothetical protein
MSALLVPWLLSQIPASFAAAAAYGVMEGWLAIDGSSDWWPLAPAQRNIDDRLILGPVPLPTPTLLDPTTTPANPDDIPRVPRRRPAPISWPRLAAPAILVALGTLWHLSAVAGAVMGNPALWTIAAQ